MGTGRHVDLCALSERIQAIERRYDETAAHRFIDAPAQACVPTGWPGVDAALGGGLSAGGLHEWFGAEAAAGRASAAPAARGSDRRWSPPLCILVHLAWQALEHRSAPTWTVWIGKPCHPYPRVLIRGEDRRLLERSLFVAPRDAAARLWAIDLALRSAAVGCVVADGTDWDRPATQRLQRLARLHAKIVLAACPPRQQARLSAAQTRWRVGGGGIEGVRESGIKGARDFLSPSLPQSPSPRWIVELLRCKGMRPAQDHRAWLLEWNRAQGVVHLSARLADLAGSAQAPMPCAEPPRRRQGAARG